MLARHADRRENGGERLDISVRENRYITEFSLKGKLYGSAVHKLEKLWIEHIETGGVLLLDIRGLTHLDTAGRRMLFLMQQEGVQVLVGADEAQQYSTALSPIAWPEAQN